MSNSLQKSIDFVLDRFAMDNYHIPSNGMILADEQLDYEVRLRKTDSGKYVLISVGPYGGQLEFYDSHYLYGDHGNNKLRTKITKAIRKFKKGKQANAKL